MFWNKKWQRSKVRAKLRYRVDRRGALYDFLKDDRGQRGLVFCEQVAHDPRFASVLPAQQIDPNRRINENHGSWPNEPTVRHSPER